ncbi:lysosomal carboxypeptidase [Reticulomyxa filosa]|uniref:Lysosomal carboxypeptidase n=1 Tax=Reticulomyxa filosa TaxID=46433 RepID=X6NDM3_RETFI|nr:lysosomal carboxypeptidase [Reticulomyxa filosa]|eukprot:ETO24400.1 lysosomal carboxypeptidase [Reticulomyxa filosa]
MELSGIRLFVVYLLLLSIDAQSPQPQIRWFTQKVDHFNPQSNQTFQQKYLVYDKYWIVNESKTGPIFFYAGNEGPIEEFWNATGLMFEMAPQFGALVVFGEHRYYGASVPTANSFEFLTIEQTIADYALLLSSLQSNISGLYKFVSPSSYVQTVAFGGSYGGVLSALCRIHYPWIVDMALASSAPWYLLLGLVNDNSYYRIITEVFQSYNGQCVDIVRSAFSSLNQLLYQWKQFELVTNLFGLCEEMLTEDEDIEWFYLWIKNAFGNLAISNYPYAIGSLPSWPLEYGCTVMLNAFWESSDSDLASIYALANLTNYYYFNNSNYPWDTQSHCFNTTKDFPFCSDHIWCGTGVSAQVWNYQQCTQVVINAITNNITDMFPPSLWDIANMTSYCAEKYGANLNLEEEIQWMRIWEPQDIVETGIDKIIFSTGMIDPWSAGGFLSNNLSYDMPVILIEDAAHHLDLRWSNPSDPISVVLARKEEIEYIQMWLNKDFSIKKIIMGGKKKENNNDNGVEA